MKKNNIKDLVFMSKIIGNNPAYVQGGGGNTSVKLDQNRMAIKASGQTLKDIGEKDGYCIVDYSAICDYLSSPDSDENIFSIKIQSFAEHTKNRPSIETGFHALLGEFVLHTHSIYANLLNCSKEGKDICYQLFPEAIWVDYETPGRFLTVRIREALQSVSNTSNVIFLQNHGVIVSGSTALEVLDLHEELNSTIQKYFSLNNSDFKVDEEKVNIRDIKDSILFPDQAVIP